MSPHVDLESAGPRVGFAADFALVGLVACVDQLVGLQMAFCYEALAAVVVGADVRALSCLWRGG